MPVTTCKRSQSAEPPSSPTTTKYQKVQTRSIQHQAFDELLLLKSANGGKLKYGDYVAVETQFRRHGFTAVTIDNLRYRMKLFNKSCQLNLASEIKSLHHI